MKAKEKNQVLINLCDEINPSDEAMLALYTTRKKGSYHAIGNMDLIRAGIHNILVGGLADNADAESRTVARAIVGAFYDVLDEGFEPDELIDDEEEEKDCAACELLKVCDEPRAMEWRKRHGILKKKNHKSGSGRKIEIN